MARLSRTSRAEGDLVEIGLYIARDSLDAALQVLDLIEEHLRAITLTPYMGENASHLGTGLRQSSVGNYVVLHTVASPEEVIIVRVIHGARDLRGAIRD